MYKLHAYLIMAHNEFDLLEKLIRLLDDKDADIYIHIDAKVKELDRKSIKNLVLQSNMFFVDSIDVQWGDRSQIDVEMLLLRKATEMEYGYYHLLSGVDLPIKTTDEINDFFKKNYGINYIDFDEKKQVYIDRVKYYHFFQNKIGKKKSLLKFIQRLIVIIQKLICLNRIKNKDVSFYKGANWFSITGDLARYIVHEFPKYDKMFDFTVCADEVFLQTIAMNSPYKDSIVNNFLREIDWKRGTPYVYRIEDFNDLINSENIFARKFSSDIDFKVIEKIYDHLKK